MYRYDYSSSSLFRLTYGIIREPGLRESSANSSNDPVMTEYVPGTADQALRHIAYQIFREHSSSPVPAAADISLFTYTPLSFQRMLNLWMERFAFSFSLESTLPHDLCSKRCEVITMRCSAWLGSSTYIGYQNAAQHIASLEEGVLTARSLLCALSDIRHLANPPHAYRIIETARCNLEALRSYLTCESTITSNLLDHWRTNSKGAVVMVLKDVSTIYPSSQSKPLTFLPENRFYQGITTVDYSPPPY